MSELCFEQKHHFDAIVYANLMQNSIIRVGGTFFDMYVHMQRAPKMIWLRKQWIVAGSGTWSDTHTLFVYIL